MDRFLDPPERAADPRPKQYDPFISLGVGTAVVYQHTPKYSFSGGKSRVGDLEKEKRILAIQREAGPAYKQPVELSMVQRLEEFKKKTKKNANSFGTAQRLRYRGGPMELPISPGPCAYEVPRALDLLPQWAPETILPYAKRTGQRPSLAPRTVSDVGPGEYTAHHTMQATKPSPLISHPLRKVGESVPKLCPGPGHYQRGTTVGCPQLSNSVDGSGLLPQPGYSFGSKAHVQKSDDDKPGPGAYDPDHTSVHKDPFCVTFGRAERVHPVDLVDPDEPPGPGNNRLKSELKTSPSISMKEGPPRIKPMKESKTPGPGAYSLRSTLAGGAASVKFPLPRPIKVSVGPGQYDPNESLTRESSFEWASPARTAKRTPFGAGVKDESSGTHVEVKMEKPVAGPKFSMGVRRDHVSMTRHEQKQCAKVPTEKENYHAMYGTYHLGTPRRYADAKSSSNWKPSRAASSPALHDSEE
jgi:hypothetical protein